MNCPHCNEQIPDEALFCPHCGKAVSDIKADETASAGVFQADETATAGAFRTEETDPAGYRENRPGYYEPVQINPPENRQVPPAYNVQSQYTRSQNPYKQTPPISPEKPKNLFVVCAEHSLPSRKLRFLNLPSIRAIATKR